MRVRRVSHLMKKVVRSPGIGRERALTTTEQVSALTHLVNSLEVLSNERDPRNAVLSDWDLLRERYTWASRPVQQALGFVSRPGVSRAIHLARAAAALSLLIPKTSRGHRVTAGAFLSLSSAITNPRQYFGTDGSDQVAFMVQGVAALARSQDDRPEVVDACLWLVGIQSSLSYATAGLAKLAGPLWRSGEALPMVLRTEAYGDGASYALAKRYPRITRAVGTGVIVLECAFPLVFAFKGRLTVPMLATTTTFHVVNGRVMGLSRFVWAFLSTYPAVLYVTQSTPRAIETGGADVHGQQK